MGSLKKNLGYQTLYQILNTCLPLITSPYLSRVLEAKQLGIFSYTQSIANYFTLIAMLGVVNYGTRTIASCMNNQKKRSDVFWNIYAFQWIISFITIIAYVMYICFFVKENIGISWIQGLYIVAVLVDISWLFFGVEKFGVIVKINMIIRVTSVILILVFVKTPKDLWIYGLIMPGGVIVSNLFLWFFASRIIDISYIKNIKLSKIKVHIKPNLMLFIPLIAMSVYRIMDKTMLGAISTFEQSGYYYNVDKIINIPVGIITGVGTVMLPRVTNIIESGKQEKSDELFKISIEILTIVSSAMAFGIAAISKEFTPFFFGKGFEQCTPLIIVLSPVLIIKGFSHTARMQYLIPNHKESIFIQSVFIGAIVNFIINIFLIPRFNAMGAVLGTLIAELITCLWQYIRMSRYINCGFIILKTLIYFLFGIVMFIMVRLIASVVGNGALGIIIEITTGATVYGLLCIVFWKVTKNSDLKLVLNKMK
ncbi:TPA: flippase [Clostridium perfringens]|uniref:flippase n=1 Tax=Clostridium perfringens TaxID=1502 RepID=UPI002AC383FF|nr:flippase [Clostridium perfringens]MDZ4964582.1 oligosaccharide flippase family protein [Clostridium perfringens]MDZ5013094.1 oligosaccharide flippase family protein [Clostridium perfringens]